MVNQIYMMKFDVITFGSAAWDISLDFPKVRIKKETDLIVDEGLLFNIGSKIDVSGINTNFGGGGINTATTFSNQGLKTAYCGAIGDDIGGREILAYLKDKKINTSFLKMTRIKKTNTSVVLKVPQKDRTILVYRGASDELHKDDLDWDNLQAKWFYLAPLSGKLSLLTDEIMIKAKEKGIKVAVNLGNGQLSFSKKRMRFILDGADVVLLNQEEASVLTGCNYNDLEELIEKVIQLRKGVTVITRGGNGVIVLAHGKIYRASMKKIDPVDNTGAGDAFGSGFIASLVKDEGNIGMAIKAGMVNAKSCLSKSGSTNGLLLAEEVQKAIKKEKIMMSCEDILQNPVK